MALAAIPTTIVSTTSSSNYNPDAPLIDLGRQLDVLTTTIDDATENRLDIEMDVLDRFANIVEEIANAQATTIEGLFVKARTACWALLGDLTYDDQATAAQMMALSIIRDLIRIHDPSLERPNAWKELVASLS
jgi:hypothetical protein